MISSGKCSRLITRRSVEFVSWTCKGTIGRFSPTALMRQNPAKCLDRGDVDGGLNYSIDAINGAGAWAATPENFRQLLRDNAWTVVGIGREEAARVTCAEFGSLKMPVLLVQGELTALSSARRLRGSLRRSWRGRSRRTEWPWTSPYE